jgi:hypothetical protein
VTGADEVKALVAAFVDNGLSPEQIQRLPALGFETLDEFAVYAALTHLEGSADE